MPRGSNGQFPTFSWLPDWHREASAGAVFETESKRASKGSKRAGASGNRSVQRMRIVVLGGYGNFGARICRALARDPGFEVIAAGRYPRAAPDAQPRTVKLDLAAADFPARLRDLAPEIVVHCAGPFQGQDYQAARSSINIGAHYVDLADAREFVVEFAGSMDAAARAANVLAICGASSVPGLSSAVVDRLSENFERVEEIQTVIAPAQRAARGAATLAGVFTYAGRPFSWLTNGEWQTVHGWQDLRRVRFAQLAVRWAAACDVPDLALFPSRYPGVKTVQFRAALEIPVQHFALWLAAEARARGVTLPIERWAKVLNRAAAMLDWFGSGRGGMLVSVTGHKPDGTRSRLEWHLTADRNLGPEVPCMSALLLTRKIARGEFSFRGASPCVGLLTLADFQPEFRRWGMTTTFEEHRE